VSFLLQSAAHPFLEHLITDSSSAKRACLATRIKITLAAETTDLVTNKAEDVRWFGDALVIALPLRRDNRVPNIRSIQPPKRLFFVKLSSLKRLRKGQNKNNFLHVIEIIIVLNPL
jgi:hypothetical protein